MKIKPADGRAARHPDSLRPLAREGEDVTPSAFWFRLIANGDVERLTEGASSGPLTDTHKESDHAL